MKSDFIPVLCDCDPPKIIGQLRMVDSKLIAKFNEPVSQDEIHSIFGNIGFLSVVFVIRNDIVLFTEIHILQWRSSKKA